MYEHQHPGKPSSESRREFLIKSLLMGMATALPSSISSCKKEEAANLQGNGKAPYKVWEEILHALRSSPDHLEGQKQALIEAGDPEAMFNFVRDEIHLMPVGVRNIGSLNQTRWGLDNVLRSGMATAREKAELLRKMYQEAGIPAEIITEYTSIQADEVPDFFFRPIDRSFAPEIDSSTLNRWRREMGTFSADLNEDIIFDDEVASAIALGEKIWAALDISEDHQFPEFDFRWDNYTPTVKFEWQGQTLFAHLFDSDIPFGELWGGASASTGAAVDLRESTEKVSVRLTYRDSIRPREEKVLVEGAWRATELVGRQLNIQFLHHRSLEEMALTPVGNVRIFTPLLSLQALEENKAYLREKSVQADPVTVEGRRIISVDDQWYLEGTMLLEKPDPDLQQQVAELDVSAKAVAYPGVKLSIAARDENGALIEGLSAADFRITEEGRPVQALMESNQRTPRILILTDISGSMPSEYRDEGMEQFIADLKADLLEQYPAAIINHWGTPSALYTWLLKASQTDHDLIIYATDGDNNDRFNPANEAIYQNGPPAIILNVRNDTADYRTETFEKMASITGGVHLPVADQQAARDGIAAYLDQIPIPPYTFSYWSVGREVQRSVQVSLDEERVRESASYRIGSKVEDQAIGPRIIGLYLEVQYGTQSRQRRVLAGLAPDLQPYATPTASMANEVHDLLLGGLQLYFEGAGPTFSAALSDLLKAKLSTRSWGEALLENEILEARQHFMEGYFNLSGKALALMGPIAQAPSEQHFTWPAGMRIGLQSLSPGCLIPKTKSRFDFLTTSQFTTFSTDARSDFKSNLLRTAQLAVRESLLFARSTRSALTNKQLISLSAARERQWLNEVNEDDLRYWQERVARGGLFRVFDQELQTKAFWDIAPTTGEVYGKLPNDSGGGEEDFENFMTALTSLLGVLEELKLLRLSVAGGLALGVVAIYGETLVRLYAVATEAIMIMDAAGLEGQVAAALKSFACEVAKEITYTFLGPLGSIMGGLETLIGLIGVDDGPFSCG